MEKGYFVTNLALIKAPNLLLAAQPWKKRLFICLIL